MEGVVSLLFGLAQPQPYFITESLWPWRVGQDLVYSRRVVGNAWDGEPAPSGERFVLLSDLCFWRNPRALWYRFDGPWIRFSSYDGKSALKLHQDTLEARAWVEGASPMSFAVKRLRRPLGKAFFFTKDRWDFLIPLPAGRLLSRGDGAEDREVFELRSGPVLPWLPFHFGSYWKQSPGRSFNTQALGDRAYRGWSDNRISTGGASATMFPYEYSGPGGYPWDRPIVSHVGTRRTVSITFGGGVSNISKTRQLLQPSCFVLIVDGTPMFPLSSHRQIGRANRYGHTEYTPYWGGDLVEAWGPDTDQTAKVTGIVSSFVEPGGSTHATLYIFAPEPKESIQMFYCDGSSVVRMSLKEQIFYGRL